MTRKTAVMELQPADRRRSEDARDGQGHDAPPSGGISMERILANMNTTPHGEVLKRIACLPDIRRGKVLRIHRQVTEGTYPVANRLDEAMDQVLEAITA
jgi:hypothetical protein